MNIEEGGRRLFIVLTWLTAIYVWIPISIAFIILAFKFGFVGVLLLLGLFLLLIVGFVVRNKCYKVGMWVIKGFVGDEKFAEEENDY